MNEKDFEIDVVAETENFAVWRSEEEEDFLFHLELGGITLHLTSEEWRELELLIKSAT